MNRLLLLGVLFLSACITRQTVISQDSFDAVELGTSSKSLEELVGKPYSIRKKGPDTYEYTYIERMMMGTEVVEQRRYIIIVKEGRVVSKKVQRSNLPAYQEINEDDPNQTEY